MGTKAEVNRELDQVFRKEFGRLVAVLTKVFGAPNLDLAESVVQEALLKAAQTWPINGIPGNPPAWIMQVAKNLAIDRIRSERRFQIDSRALDVIPDANDGPIETAQFELELRDDQVRMMFVCCHPSLPHNAQVALVLKSVCGFGVTEIARAYLTKPETIAQRLVRAKQRIKDLQLPFAVPPPAELTSRVDAIADAVYLMFNEGYSVSQGDQLVNHDICLDACRIGRLLTEHPVTGIPNLHALLALMLFQTSRLATRVGRDGEVLLLADQDRTAWDQNQIAEGLAQLSTAAHGSELSKFHVLAGIAATHATAESFEATDWPRILQYYDALMRMTPSGVVALNRAVAVYFVHGIAEALAAVEALQRIKELDGYYLLPATLADLYRRAGEWQKAKKFYHRALELVGTSPEKRFLQRQLDNLA